MVKARTSPLVAMSALVNSVLPHLAQALRRSKKRAPHEVHSLATRCGESPSSKIVDQRNLLCHLPPNFGPGVTPPP